MAKSEKRITLLRGALLASALSSLLFSSAASALPDRPESFKRDDVAAAQGYLDEYVEHWMDELDVPGLSISIFDRDAIIMSKGYGYADMDKEIPAKPDTVYRVGGVTTLFTALSVMQLHEQGKLGLDDPIGKYLPEFSINTRWEKPSPITIHQLLTHYGGLPVSLFKGMWAHQPQTPQELLSVLSDSYATFQPGEIYAFSNLGYVLLGLVVERVSGLPYPEYIRQNIIEPLGLKHTGFALEEGIKQRFSRGYKKDELKPVLHTRDVPALGLYSTTADLARFVQAFVRKQAVISERVSKTMLTPQNHNPVINTGHHIGYGWNLDDARLDQVKRVANRWGSTLLFRSRVMLLPDEGIGVIVNANSSKGFRAVDEIAAEAIRVMLEVKMGIKHREEESEEVVLEPVANVAPFQSEYSTMAGYSRIRQKGADFYANIMGWNLHLRPQGNGWYGVQYDFLGFLPIKLDWFAEIRIAPIFLQNEPALLSYFNGRTTLFGTTLPVAEDNTPWKRRIGEYALANPDELTDFYDVKEGQIREENGRLLFDYNIPFFMDTTVSLPLIPLSDELAIIPGKGSAFNEMIRVVNRNGREHLVYSGYELSKTPD